MTIAVLPWPVTGDKQRSAVQTYASVSEFRRSPLSNLWIRMRKIWKFVYPFAMDTCGCKVRGAEKFEKFVEMCAWKALFHTSYGFFATLWLVKGCFLDHQNAQILVINCPIWRKTKSSIQLERKERKSV